MPVVEVDYLFVSGEYYFVTSIGNGDNVRYVHKNGCVKFFAFDCDSWSDVAESKNSAYHKKLESVMKMAAEFNFTLKFNKNCLNY